MLHYSLMLLSFLFSFRHIAEHSLHLRSEIKKEQFFFANGRIYFSVKCKLGIGACFLFGAKQGQFS